MNELTFRGKDRYHPSWRHLWLVILALVVEGAASFSELGVVGFYWLFGVTVVLIGLGVPLAFRSWTTVGAAGITICRGIGRGHTHPWHEIRWIEVHETRSEHGTSLTARITLANGRRRSLPAVQHSTQYPDPDFGVNFGQIANWWEMSTDPSARFRPPGRLRDRLTPTGVGVILGLLIAAVLFVYVVVK